MVRGRIHMHTSPFEHRVLAGFFKNMYKQAFRKIRDNIFDVGPAVLLYGGIYFWAKNKAEENAREHWH